MALQVWLPLNDSIQNKGLNNATVTVNGTTAYADGNRGRCLSCNGSSYWLISPLTIGTTASISFWAKTTDTNAMFYVLGATSYAHLNFWRANSKYYLNKGDSYQNPFQNNGADVTWHNDGNWHHYVTVFDGSMCSLYVDGAYYGTAKTYAAPTCNGTNVRLAGGFSNGHSYDTNGFISDFRVYDNVLTNEDIKELYWGKILEFTPQWLDKDRIMDASGFNFPLTPHNLTISGNEAKFNGSSTYVEFNGLHLSGGSVSIWANLPAKPNAQKIYYCDPTSKMVVGYLTGGTILTAANGANKASYQSTGITWKQWHHIVAVWNSSYVPTALYVNGVQAATGTSSNWTNSGAIAGIGRRIGSGNADYLSGSVNEVKVFSSQLTAADVQKLYAMGPSRNVWGVPSEYTRLEYLEGTGTQWINTEFLISAANLPKMKYKLDAIATDTAVGNRWWACGLGGAAGIGFHVGIGNGKTSPLPFTYSRGIADAVTTVNGSLGVRYKWELDMPNQTYKVWLASTMETLVDTTFTRQTPTQQQNMALYRWLRYSGSTANPNGYIFGMKIYSAELYEDSILVRKLIPAKRKSDNVLGLYDSVTERFFTNAGTGTFVAGPEV